MIRPIAIKPYFKGLPRLTPLLFPLFLRKTKLSRFLILHHLDAPPGTQSLKKILGIGQEIHNKENENTENQKDKEILISQINGRKHGIEQQKH